MTNKAKSRLSGRMLPIMHRDAAGIDIGAEEIFVSVPPDRDTDSVRRFATFTRDLYALADWLRECNIRSVAMESTGVYWIPLYQILETQGLEVFLVNAHHVKNVPGRKSDVSDCQGIQHLHSVGLLKASFRPPDEICVLRSLWRHREGLVQMGAEHVQLMQKALSQMNLQLHHVLSDIVGVSGMAILDAILAGERDQVKLASLCNRRVRSSRQTVANRQSSIWTLRSFEERGDTFCMFLIAHVFWWILDERGLPNRLSSSNDLAENHRSQRDTRHCSGHTWRRAAYLLAPGTFSSLQEPA